MAINLLVSPWVVGWIIVFNTHPKIHCKHLQLIWPTGETAVLHKADQIKLFAALQCCHSDWKVYNPLALLKQICRLFRMTGREWVYHQVRGVCSGISPLSVSVGTGQRVCNSHAGPSLGFEPARQCCATANSQCDLY